VDKKGKIMKPIKMIAIDLDGTLLNSEKKVSTKDQKMIERAAKSGVYIVPATGRLYNSVPEEVKSLHGVRYLILANGAVVYDMKEDRDVFRAEIPREHALEIFKFLDTYPCIYGCYMNDLSWMTLESKELIDRYVPEVEFRQLIRAFNETTENLYDLIASRDSDVQKIQLFSDDATLIDYLLVQIPKIFPDVVTTSSIRHNVEINAVSAQKGIALLRLADLLGIDQKMTMAIGDGINDLDMINSAGVGVAMANAYSEEVKKAADYITSDCDESGVAEAIIKFCFPKDRIDNYA
jgi:Cof subfamily protein (haloacid dehalogenase superfamily)